MHLYLESQVAGVAHAKHGGAEGLAAYKRGRMDARLATKLRVGGWAGGRLGHSGGGAGMFGGVGEGGLRCPAVCPCVVMCPCSMCLLQQGATSSTTHCGSWLYVVMIHRHPTRRSAPISTACDE